MTQIENIKKYLESDEIFNKINKLFISLDPFEVKEQNPHIKEIFESLKGLMKQQSPLFDKYFEGIAWVGSFYKNTRNSTPEEYDVNFVIKLPFKEKDLEFSTDCPGYVKIRTTWTDKDFKNLNINPKAYKELNSFIDNSYLNQEKFRRWIEGIFSKVAVHTSEGSLIKLHGYPPITLKKSGPAFTLQVQLSQYERKIDIDIVPVLAFLARNSPPRCSKEEILQKYPNKYWYVVPKPLNNNGDNFNNPKYYWRLSYYEFEKEMLTNHDYGRVKPIIRHLKKFRDTLEWKCLASYYLEILCLQNLEIFHISKHVSSTFLFFTMLQNLYTALCEHTIQFYWDEDFNLLENIRPREMENMTRRLNRIIKDIEKNIKNDKYAVAKYVLTKDELNKLYLSNPSITPLSEQSSELEPEPEPEPSTQWRCIIA